MLQQKLTDSGDGPHISSSISSSARARRGTTPNKRRSPKVPEEPKIKKKPGPKPGWKNKFKPKGYTIMQIKPDMSLNATTVIQSSENASVFTVREELPNIYKCPYQGCTAVYRAPDGLKVRYPRLWQHFAIQKVINVQSLNQFWCLLCLEVFCTEHPAFSKLKLKK